MPNCPLPLGSAIQFTDEQTGFAISPSTTVDFFKDFDIRINTGVDNVSIFITKDGGLSWSEVVPKIKY